MVRHGHLATRVPTKEKMTVRELLGRKSSLPWREGLREGDVAEKALYLVLTFG